MLHPTDIKKYKRCPRAFWLSRRQKKKPISLVNYSESMSELAKQLLMIREEDASVGQVDNSGGLALRALHEKKVLIHARFIYEDLRVNVPSLVQEDDRRILYLTCRSCFPKERETVRMAQYLVVLEKPGVSINAVCAIHLNTAYIRGKEPDVRQLLIVDGYSYSGRNKVHETIQKLLDRQEADLDVMLEKLHAYETMDDVPVKRSHACTRGGKYMYHDDCFLEVPADDSILNLMQAAQKYETHEEGITILWDADIGRIERTRHQYVQVMVAHDHGLYADKGTLRYWKKAYIQTPVSYLDFEWETHVFPPYEGMKSFDVLAFQRSLHVEEQQKLRHIGFIGEGDCRRAFPEYLLAHIPKAGTALVYNMGGTGRLRLVQLTQQFPEYEERSRAVWERMADLSLPSSAGNVYDIRMAGFHPLKRLVPVLSNHSYQDLKISYSTDAVEKWREYCTADAEKEQEIYGQLEQYRTMDIYAEYIVYHALEDMIRD